ncbi:hypothetical protein N7478_010539 [Penicillium angulare]|uniref:uncharacterized protein n=1 Tax=Penicillium angulare TaxID=116970 RepID=UPI00253FC091|nr:uncharacterized protein N7478_010539 [Penicillium angulare]KAJ5267731.1 hypothetical protein N7478_010539 [Penicillium angulare]
MAVWFSVFAALLYVALTAYSRQIERVRMIFAQLCCQPECNLSGRLKLAAEVKCSICIVSPRLTEVSLYEAPTAAISILRKLLEIDLKVSKVDDMVG